MPSKYYPKPRTKELPCRHCGEPMTVGWQQRKLPAHNECSIKLASDASMQMHNKSGPVYDRWKLAMIRSFLDETLATPGGADSFLRVTDGSE